MVRHWAVLCIACLSTAAIGCGSKQSTSSNASKAGETSPETTQAAYKESAANAARTGGSTNAPDGCPVAVIDLNIVAHQLGRIEVFQKLLQEKQANLQARLQLLQTGYESDFQDKRSEFGEQLSDEEQKELNQFALNVNEDIQLARQRAQNEINTHQQRLKTQFLNEVRPIAYQIAKEQGMHVVLTTTQVFAAGPERDITAAVVAKMKSLAPPDSQESEPAVTKLPARGGTFDPR